MKISLVGRIRNTKLAPSRALLPVFEAVINSLQAIDMGSVRKGRIDIRVERLAQQEIDAGDGHHAPIVGFLVSDNGPGFDEKNFESFETSDSTLKEDLGGKGVGRLLWLKAFEDVAVDSVFLEPGGTRSRRSFVFRLDDQGVNDDKVEQVPPTEPFKTTVHLRGFKAAFAEKCPKGLAPIAQKLIEHCLTFFIFESKTEITLSDGVDTLDVRSIYREQFAPHTDDDRFEVGGQTFGAKHVRLYSAEAGSHRLHFCAHRREVFDENLHPLIPNLRGGRVADGDGRPFFWSTFVSGPFLDTHVEPERTGFTFPSDPTALFPDEITLTSIRSRLVPVLKSRLDEYLAPVQKEKMEKIQRYISTKAPQYRIVEKYAGKELENVAPDLSEQALDLALYSLQHRIEGDVRKAAQVLEPTEENSENQAEYEKLIEKATDIGQSNLAKYVVQRRIILDLFEKTLGVNASGKHSPESAVHRIIFPLRKTSDEVLENQQNLWIIDERLAYHSFLASDKPLASMPAIDTASADRPDLIVFNSPFAFADGSPPFSSVVIIEFKRPVREDYAEDENPVTQVYDYVAKVRAGTTKDRRGRPLQVPSGTPFYCYVICDLTSKMRTFAENAALTPAPDSMGFLGFNQNRNAYLEVLSYTKLVEDAKKRNRVFFEKLNLPLT